MVRKSSRNSQTLLNIWPDNIQVSLTKNWELFSISAVSRFLYRVWISSKEISQLGSWRKTSSWSKILSRHLPLATMPRDSSSWFNDRMVYVQSKWKSNRCRAEFGGEEARDFVVGSVVRYWLDRIESSSSVLAELERTKREFDTNDDSRQETRRQVAVDWRGSSLSLNIPEWWPRINVSFQPLQALHGFEHTGVTSQRRTKSATWIRRSSPMVYTCNWVIFIRSLNEFAWKSCWVNESMFLPETLSDENVFRQGLRIHAVG